ncbi:hypothetical protein V6Z12_A13G231700 [Gossypium hirsutum]
MIKQILRKLPRKSQKSDSLDSAGNDSDNHASNSDDGVQCTNFGNKISSRLRVVKRVSSAVFPASIMAGVEAVEPNLSFNNVSNPQKPNLFISKLNLCCEACNSSDPDKGTAEQDLKRRTLIELVDFVSSGSAKFNEAAIAAMCKMCAINLFRVFPPKYRSNTASGEADDEEPVFDPAWSNLQLVYDLFLQFIGYSSLDAKVAKKYIDQPFILRLLDLFESEDPRERDCLKTILHRIYGKFTVHRPFVRKAVSNIIYTFVFETERHNGIAELLEIFGSIISGFAVPLKEEHKMFLCRVLIPLHKPKSYWPVTNSQKELMFISESEEILEMISMTEFQKIMVPLFRRIACCLNSFHYQVAERAHMLCNNEHVLNLIKHNRQIIFPLIFPALERNSRNHWHQTVLNLTKNTRKMLSEIDDELTLACERKLEEENSQSNEASEKRKLTWERLELAAGFEPAAANLVPPLKPATCSVAC